MMLRAAPPRMPPSHADDDTWATYLSELAVCTFSHVEEQPEQPQEVAHCVFLGGLDEAEDIELLQERGIDCILNMAPRQCGPCSHRGYPANFKVYDLEVEDCPTCDIFEEAMPLALDFIKECVAESRSVLVHCYAGMNRSAAVCAAWMVMAERMSLPETVEQLARLRGLVLQNPRFNEGLAVFARSEGCLVKDALDSDRESDSVSSQWKSSNPEVTTIATATTTDDEGDDIDGKEHEPSDNTSLEVEFVTCECNTTAPFSTQ